MTIYYLVYFSLFFLSFIGCRTTNRRQIKLLLCLMLIVMTLFQGLRWNTGADWEQYRWIFYELRWKDLFGFSRNATGNVNLEEGYVLINLLIKSIFNHYTAFLIITCGFINYSLARFIFKYIPKYQTLCFASVLLYSAMFPVRNVLAGAVFSWAIPYLLKRNIYRYLLIVLLSASIHFSAFLFIPFYWLNKSINTKIILGMYCCLTAISQFLSNNLLKIAQMTGNEFLVNLVTVYKYVNETTSVETSFPLVSFVLGLIMLFFICDYRKKCHYFDNNLLNFLVNTAFLSILFLQLAKLPNSIKEFSRISYFCYYGYPILLIYILSYYTRKIITNKHLTTIIITGILFIMFAYRMYSIQNDYYSSLFIPYYSVFEDSPLRDGFTY